MKYSKIYEDNGFYYVMQGNKKYLPYTKSESESAAMIWAKIASAKWHLHEAAKIMQELELSKVEELTHNQFWDLQSKVCEVMRPLDQLHRRQTDYDERDPCTFMY